jgi:hypothetical protein
MQPTQKAARLISNDFKAVGNTYYNHIIRGLASAAIEVSPSKERQR